MFTENSKARKRGRPIGRTPEGEAARQRLYDTAIAMIGERGFDGTTLRGVAARIVQNMDASLEVPTATSVRAVPAKLLVDNRIVINNHLARGRGGKVSFTHLIGWALVRSVIAHPEMNNSFAEVDGKPAMVQPEHINLGIAIDLAKKDGTRTLVVPSIKNCERMDFRIRRRGRGLRAAASHGECRGEGGESKVCAHWRKLN
jgi:pyruvate/2-oxoglutarate dehydrogenase complex dihydrolipoamide acyltransferase (E2) component